MSRPCRTGWIQAEAGVGRGDGRGDRGTAKRTQEAEEDVAPGKAEEQTRPASWREASSILGEVWATGTQTTGVVSAKTADPRAHRPATRSTPVPCR